MALIIQPPPLPELSALGAVAASAAGILLSVMLVLWGRTVGKIILTLLAAAGGTAGGAAVAEHFAFNIWAGRCAGAFAGGIIGYLLCALIWAVVVSLAALAGAAVLLIFSTWREMQQQIQDFQPAAPVEGTPYLQALGQYLGQAWQYARTLLEPAWRNHSYMVIALCGALWLIPLLVGLLRPRLMSIFASSLLGAVTMVAICAGLIAWIWPGFPLKDAAAWYLALGASLVAFVWGITWQYRGAFRAEQKSKPDEEQPKQKETAEA